MTAHKKPSFKHSLRRLLTPFWKHNAALDQGKQTAPLDAEIILEKALALKQIPVKNIMVPRTDIIWLEADSPLSGVVKIAEATPFTRFPVCRGKLDHVLGITTASQIMSKSFHKDNFSLKTQLKKPFFVSPALSCMDLLLTMTQKNHYIALVVDEYGGIDGLITLRDLMQEIIGKLDEETMHGHDPIFVTLPDDSLLVDGRLPIDELEDALKIKFFRAQDMPEVDTLAGLVTHLAGHVPKRGAVVTHKNGIQFEVVESDPRKVKRLKMRLPKKLIPDADIV